MIYNVSANEKEGLGGYHERNRWEKGWHVIEIEGREVSWRFLMKNLVGLQVISKLCNDGLALIK